MIRRVVLSLLAAAAVVSPATAATVITGERMLDVETGRYVQNPAIFVDDTGHITSIADARTVRWGADVKHIDLGNRTLLPGLIDMHTHVYRYAINLGVDSACDPAPQPLLAPPENCNWKILWSSERPAYGGRGTPELQTNDSWCIQGYAATLLTSEP